MENDKKSSVKTIVLVICASNFERHQHIIKAVREELSKRGSFVLYVLTNYGVYLDAWKMNFSHGESADYSLLDTMKIDGCILESNIASMELVGFLMNKLKKRNIPTVTINLDVEGVPTVKLDARRATYELMTHLAEVHGCRNINLVLSEGNTSISDMAERTYREVLTLHGITPENSRILQSWVGIKQGRKIYEKYDYAGVMKDCDAVICVHDVCAIGLIMELEDRGIRVPEDIKVCSLNHSNNSKAFRPDITGIDPMEREAVAKVCDILISHMEGLPVPMETIYEGRTLYRRSCGCVYQLSYEKETSAVYQSIIYNKIEAGSQIMNMMRFNDMLEQVETIDRFGQNMERLMMDLGVSNFFCCLNESDIDYIMSDMKDHKDESDPPYDEFMKIIAMLSDNKNTIGRGMRFPKSKVIPIEPSEGDLLLVYPIHYKKRDFGYIVFRNEYVPLDVYNYRICHEGIGNNIENLRRQMILRNNLNQLEELHMRDQMTNLYNRYGLTIFASGYEEKETYSVAMIDMDGLKTINDTYGHQAGNNAICTLAFTITDSVDKDDFVVRYGGDEFIVLSRNGSADYWEKLKTDINERLKKEVSLQKLPYILGVSLGYAISDHKKKLTIDQAIEIADQVMYEDKKRRKQLI